MTAASSSQVLSNARRIVVKVGSSLVTNEGKGLDEIAIGEWCRQIAAIRSFTQDGEEPKQIIMVSSGAIAEGMKRLGWVKRPSELHALQAAAAVGQMGLAQMYETKFREQGLGTAQILLTHADLADRERYLNARSTLLTLLEHGIVPIINENDTVVNDEIKFGDNDTLGALVANLIDADLLVILTDQKGLFTADPRRYPDATLVTEAAAGDLALETMAGGAGSSIGRGGMLTKIIAAKRAAGSGASTVIAWGRELDSLVRLCNGERIGTLLIAQTGKTQARKQWIADHLQLRGALFVDAGAVRVLQAQGRSLLPVGMLSVSGDFSRGDVVAIKTQEGFEIGRGLTNYSSNDARRICGQLSVNIRELLGYVAEPEIVHRDNMVVHASVGF